MDRVPELAGRELTLTTLSGGITNRNFLVSRRPGRTSAGSSAWPAMTRTCSASAARSSTPRRWPRRGRRRTRGHRVHPARGLPRHAVHRRLAGQRRGGPAGPRPSGASPIRSDASTMARPIPGLFVPLRIVEAYRALAVARGVPIPPEYEVAAAIGRRIELALAGRARRAAAVPQRPAQRELHRRRHPHPHRRLGVRGDG